MPGVLFYLTRRHGGSIITQLSAMKIFALLSLALALSSAHAAFDATETVRSHGCFSRGFWGTGSTTS